MDEYEDSSHFPTPEQEIDWAEANDYMDEDIDRDEEPDIDFGFEHDSSMASAGWGTDEDYGYFGGDEY